MKEFWTAFPQARRIAHIILVQRCFWKEQSLLLKQLEQGQNHLKIMLYQSFLVLELKETVVCVCVCWCWVFGWGKGGDVLESHSK